MARQRSAHDSLRGYRYQLDASVLAILGAANGESITLEGIEDIDKAGVEHIQCKYLESKAPWPSAVKDAVLELFRHAHANPQVPIYTLYAHFGQAAAEPLTDDKIADALDPVLPAEGFTRASLLTFLSTRYRLVKAEQIDAHSKKVYEALKQTLNGSSLEVETLFYPRALSEAIRLATQPNPADRTTTRPAFLEVVNKRETLFRSLLARLRGINAYFKHVSDEADKLGVLVSTRWVIVHFALAQTASLTIPDFCTRVLALSACRFREHYHLRSTLPLTIVLEEPEARMRDLKREALRRGLNFNDGREDLGFTPTVFDAAPVIERRRIKGRLTDVIDRASYCLRLVRSETLVLHARCLSMPHTLVVVGNNGILPYEPAPEAHILHIDDVTDIADLVGVLKRGPHDA